MSEKKKVIYVKDLVIKADNVTIEPPKPRHRPFDPFFGPVGRVEDNENEKMNVEAVEDEEEYKDNDVKDVDVEDVEDDDDKRPFSWI